MKKENSIPFLFFFLVVAGWFSAYPILSAVGAFGLIFWFGVLFLYRRINELGNQIQEPQNSSIKVRITDWIGGGIVGYIISLGAGKLPF